MPVDLDRKREQPSRLALGARLAVGDAAPDVTVLDSSGRDLSLADIWSRGPVVLTFLRHFG